MSLMVVGELLNLVAYSFVDAVSNFFLFFHEEAYKNARTGILARPPNQYILRAYRM